MERSGPRPGDVIAGKYRVRTILGRGRGVLLLGEHLGFEQRVAIRVVSRTLANEVELAKFRRETRVLAKLGSEHAARIFDVGELDDGSFYLVRQYLEGIDLVAHLHERRTLAVDEAISIVLQATEAVAEAHAHGVLMRELAPEHIFLADRSPGIKGGKRIAKLIDFGTAKLFAEANRVGPEDEHTATAVLGLSPYSSPEMLRRQPDLDVRTDVWSLGAILYELLTGRAPFGSDMMSLALSIVRDDPAPLRRFRPELPVELERAVLRTLAKARDDRPADTHAFAASLAQFAPPEGRILMERIHDLASAARHRASGYEDELMEVEEVEEIDEVDIRDEPTNESPQPLVSDPAPTLLVSATAPRTVTQEKTEALGFSFQPIDPRPASRTEPPPSMRPLSWPMTDLAAVGRHGGPQPAARMVLAPASSHTPSPALGVPPSGAWIQGTPTNAWLARSDDLGRKIALYAVGGGLAALVVLLVLILVIPPGGPTPAGTPSVAASHASAPEPPGVDASLPRPGTPDAVVAGSSTPADSASAALSAKPATEAETSLTSKSAAAPRTSRVLETSPSAPSPRAPPSTPEKGTLVAIAVGGTCAFGVNGASKGTSTSMKLSVNPGNYTITCKPTSGATKSKSVEVKSAATAMATFKL